MVIYILCEVVNGEVNVPIAYKDFDTALSELYCCMASAFGYIEAEIPIMIKDFSELQSQNNKNEYGLLIDYDTPACSAWGITDSGKSLEWIIACCEI